MNWTLGLCVVAYVVLAFAFLWASDKIEQSARSVRGRSSRCVSAHPPRDGRNL